MMGKILRLNSNLRVGLVQFVLEKKYKNGKLKMEVDRDELKRVETLHKLPQSLCFVFPIKTLISSKTFNKT